MTLTVKDDSIATIRMKVEQGMEMEYMAQSPAHEVWETSTAPVKQTVLRDYALSYNDVLL